MAGIRVGFGTVEEFYEAGSPRGQIHQRLAVGESETLKMERRRFGGGGWMRFRIAFDVSVDSGIFQYGGRAMPSDWAVEVAEKLRKRQQARRHQDELLLEKRRLFEEQGPNL